mmetsp:Transcript_57919/g.119620  ORF Transcript_57919/g.119620 Transcript_57919/m.119620 type:complete len:104 (+) Transcript_57919:259-570(+)
MSGTELDFDTVEGAMLDRSDGADTLSCEGASRCGAEAASFEPEIFGKTPLPLFSADSWLSGIAERAEGGAAERQLEASTLGTAGGAGLLSLHSDGCFHTHPRP